MREVKIRQNFQNLWDTAKSVLRGKFIANSFIQAYLQKQEKYQINIYRIDPSTGIKKK